MGNFIKKATFSNITLKVISLIFGCIFWYILSKSYYITVWLTVPLCFHSIEENIFIKAPETIKIALAGKRSDLYNLDRDNLAVHINGKSLHQGDNVIPITSQHLFLPDLIKLVDYSPSHIVITIQEHNIA